MRRGAARGCRSAEGPCFLWLEAEPERSFSQERRDAPERHPVRPLPDARRTAACPREVLRGELRKAVPQVMPDEWVLPQGKTVEGQVSPRRVPQARPRELSEQLARPPEPQPPGQLDL